MKNSMETQDIIALLDVYFNEFKYRDQLLWSNTFKFFYVIMIVILFPNISGILDINFPFLPILLFRIIGFIVSFIFLYVALSYAKRLEASTKTYNAIIGKLEIEYQRVSIKNLKFGKFFMCRLSYIIVFVMFSSIIIINILLIIFDK